MMVQYHGSIKEYHGGLFFANRTETGTIVLDSVDQWPHPSGRREFVTLSRVRPASITPMLADPEEWDAFLGHP